MSISGAMIEFRKATKLSQGEVADLLGFCPSLISHIENRKRDATPTIKWRVEEALEHEWVHRAALQQLYDAIVHDLRRKESPYLE